MALRHFSIFWLQLPELNSFEKGSFHEGTLVQKRGEGASAIFSITQESPFSLRLRDKTLDSEMTSSHIARNLSLSSLNGKQRNIL